MSLPRFYQKIELSIDASVNLDKDASHHLCKVLRLKVEDEVVLFNGDGCNYLARISSTGKTVIVDIKSRHCVETKSPILIHLGQCISKNERMDFTIQKSVELGVHQITPLISERVQFRFDEKRKQKKLNHWRKIIISACEQSGRTDIPELNEPVPIEEWLDNEQTMTLLFDPNSQTRLKDLQTLSSVRILIGPEGGFSAEEITMAKQSVHYKAISLGPRILRTETAGLAIVSVLQSRFGDL